jgi:hypothetical protein
MYLKPAISSIVACLLATSFVSAQSLNGKTFTLQVASFAEPAAAHEFAAILGRQSLNTALYTVKLPGRGTWTRVFVEKFKTASEAQKYGQRLLVRGLIGEFVVTRINKDELRAATQDRTSRATAAYSRPLIVAPGLLSERVNTSTAANDGAVANMSRSATESVREPGQSGILNAQRAGNGPADRVRLASALDEHGMPGSGAKVRSAGGLKLPASRRRDIGVVPTLNSAQIPRPNPVQLAFNLIGGTRSVDAFFRRGGLWLSGDVAEGLARLRWIAGPENAELITADREGQVRLDLALLASLAGLDKAAAAVAPAVAADYIVSNEGLMLLVQVSQGTSRYRLHLGNVAPTLGAFAKISGSINLDNNFDSRINPYRQTGRKFANEQPPNGFEALIGMNPEAQWFNMAAGCLVPVGHITFHELAEAYAKVEFGLDYLPQSQHPGAHNIAIEREKILKRQRPSSDIVVTLGSNRVLRSREEVRAFYAASGSSAASQR